MRRSLPLAMALGVLLAIGVGAAVMAHEGGGEEGLQVEPNAVTAGGSVILAGSGLEPNNERILVLVGQGLTVDLGNVTTDGEGMFSLQLTVPSHLPTGTYEMRAIGDETITVPLAVSGAGAAGAEVADSGGEAVVARQRSPLELGLVLALVAVAAGVGAWLVWRAERFRGTPTA